MIENRRAIEKLAALPPLYTKDVHRQRAVVFHRSRLNRRKAFKIGVVSGKQLIEAITRVPPEKVEALGAFLFAVHDTKAQLTKALEIATVCERRFLAALSLRADIHQVFEAAQRIASEGVDTPPLH